MTKDWMKRAASFSGVRSDVSSDTKTKFLTFSFLKKKRKSDDYRLSTDSTLIGDLDIESKESSVFTNNPFSSVSDYRRAAQQSEDPKFRFQFANFLIEAAYETQSKFFIDEARQWLEILANPSLIPVNSQSEVGPEQGFVLAQYMLANWHMSGSYDVKVDQKKAFELYKTAASQDHAASAYLLAKCYQDGIGTEKNEDEARKSYQKASLLGDSRSSFILGHAFIYGGIGLESNPQLFLDGIELLKRCINDPYGEFYSDALYELSVLHSGSKKTKSRITDHNYSLSCLTMAANLDHDISQYRLGYNYEHGLLSLPADSQSSIYWYSRAASLGNADACLGLSGWYLTGAQGVVPKSYEDAYLWARKSADKGSSRGHFAVGYFMENGIGVKLNKNEAKKWYKRAASMGDKKAIARLDDLKSQRNLFRRNSAKSNFSFF